MNASVPHYYELCAWAGDGLAAAELRELREDLHTTWRALSNALNNTNQMAR